MILFDYSGLDCPYPIRDDLPAAYRETWADLARPGTWWTGAERIAIAEACRGAQTCGFCAERRQALSLGAVEGNHDGESPLSDVAVDAVHRIVSDQTRLSKDWVTGLAGSGISDGHYVELLGIVVNVLSIDEFHRTLGLPLEPLPEPEPGEPTRHRPGSLDNTLAWVPVLEPKRLGETEADLFVSNRPGNIVLALTLVPDALRVTKRLSTAQYLPLDRVPDLSYDPGRAIHRPQMELVAARISALNECFY